MSNHGVFSRRRLLGAGAVAGATTLAGAPRALARAQVPSPPLGSAAVVESRFYAGLSLSAGNELTTATGTVFVKDPFNGSYPSTVNGYVGTALDVPAGSNVVDVVFYLYQQGPAQLCAVQLYHPGATTAGYEVLLSQVAEGTGVVAVSTAASSGQLPRVITADDALCGFVWRGQQSAVCRGIRVDYTTAGGGVGATGSGLVPIPPARVYDSRQGAGKLRDGEERVVSLAAAVPLGATAAAITLTVSETEGAGGYVAAFPAGTSWSGTSTVNWFGSGQNLATAAILALGGDREIVLRGGAASTHVIVDVTTYSG